MQPLGKCRFERIDDFFDAGRRFGCYVIKSKTTVLHCIWGVECSRTVLVTSISGSLWLGGVNNRGSRDSKRSRGAEENLLIRRAYIVWFHCLVEFLVSVTINNDLYSIWLRFQGTITQPWRQI